MKIECQVIMRRYVIDHSRGKGRFLDLLDTPNENKINMVTGYRNYNMKASVFPLFLGEIYFFPKSKFFRSPVNVIQQIEKVALSCEEA